MVKFHLKRSSLRDKYVAYSAKVGQLVFSEIQEQLDNSGNKLPFAKNPNRAVLAHINLICLKARSKTTWEFRKAILRILLFFFSLAGCSCLFFVLSVLCFPKQSKTLCKEW